MSRLHRILMVIALIAIAIPASADESRRIEIATPEGSFTQQDRQPGEIGPSTWERGSRDDVLWQRTVNPYIYSSCAVSTWSVFAGTANATPAPAEYLADGSDGVPTWTHSGGKNQVFKRNQTLLLIEENSAIDGATVRAWSEGLVPTELWSYHIPDCMLPEFAIDMSDNGLVSAVAVRLTGNTARVLCFDSNSGALLSSFDAPPGNTARAMALSGDGQVAAVRASAVVHVFDVATGALRASLNTGASSSPLAISYNGEYVASGWTYLMLWQWNGSSYTQLWANNGGGSNWYLSACDFGGGQLVAAWNSSGYTQNKVQWFDPALSTPQWTWTGNSSNGVHQDRPSDVAVAFTGDLAVVGSWGDDSGQSPEINIFLFNHDEPIYSVDSPGSIYSVDIDAFDRAGGRYPAYVTACGKHVHANEFGNGGDLFMIMVSHPTGLPEETTPASRLAVTSYPNPFNPATTLRWNQATAGRATLAIFDTAGRRLRTLVERRFEAGEQEARWDGRDDLGRALPSGVYMAKLITEVDESSTRLLLLK